MAPTNLIIFASIFGGLFSLLKWLLKQAKKISAENVVMFKPDPFLKHYKYTWDFVFVFKVYEEDERLNQIQRDNTLKKTIRRLNKGGLQSKMFYSVQKDEVYVKVRATMERLKMEAARINYKMLLDEHHLKARARMGYMDDNRQLLWAPIDPSSSKRFSKLSAWKYIYGRFVNDPKMEELYQRHTSSGSVFRSMDRIKLLQRIMEAETYEGGCGMNINIMVKKHAVLAAFPLHTWTEKMDIEHKVLTLFMAPWKTPVDDIKDYFGEKVGLYFLFLTHYTTWLLWAGIAGVLIYVHVSILNDPNAPSVPAFCAFIALWTTMFLEFWKRKEVRKAMIWGTKGYEDFEGERPEFEGDIVDSPVDGSKIKWANPKKQGRAQAFSQATIAVSILCVVGAVASIFLFKIQTLKPPMKGALTINGKYIGGFLVSIANAIQIQVMSLFYNKIAIALNEAENHRTDTAYEDSLIAKTFIFQFVNSFASLFYIAFFKRYLDPEGCAVSCMNELSTALSTIFLTRLVTFNISAIPVAWWSNEQKKKAEMEGVRPGVTLTPAEKEYAMERYDVLMSTFVNYAELAVQYGYATMFAAGFPLSPIMACLNNYIKIRVDLWKMTQIQRRPEPRTAEDIGTWFTIFDIMSHFCVLTNCGLVFFTGTFFDLTYFQRMACFVCFEHILLCAKYVFSAAVPDMPQEVQIQLDRCEHFVSKVIENTPDEKDEGEALKEDFHFVIDQTDTDYFYEGEYNKQQQEKKKVKAGGDVVDGGDKLNEKVADAV